MKISDVVRPKEEAAFKNDVQLRWYATGGSENMSLVRSYMFTRKSVGQRKSPIDILYQLRQAFLTDTYENRFVVIATYGHGKSHLALALANYFGKREDSEECEALYASITHAFSGEAEAEGYREFKRSKKRMLVVCLEGTRPGELSQQFLQALSLALKSENETKNQELPFWTREATRVIESISASDKERTRANAFLKDHDTDMVGLLAAIDGQDTNVYNLVRELVHHVRGVRPDLGGPASLASAVEWAADEFCGMEESKPFGGMLILFDEFSAFLRNYGVRTTAGNPLQDLLDGVSNRKGKVVFAAFGQLEPTATIDSVFSMRQNNAAREALLVELTRLPAAFHYQLYTTLEDVIDSYLWQDEDALGKEFEDKQAWPALLEATDDCLLIFTRRYERELGWDSEEFQQRVTVGSFPLHPMTTALICNVELLESANPRSVLGFVLDELGRLAERPVVVNQMPTWVNPTTLVDEFGKQLADEEWKQYQEALRQRAGDLTNDEAAVLKAMLLHLVGRMPTNLVPYSKAIASLSGLSPDLADKILKDLATVGVIEHQIAQGRYGFWSAGGGARLLHEHINRQIASRSLAWNELSQINKDGRGFQQPSLPVRVPWGHQDDWQAEQYYLTHNHLSKEKVSELSSSTCGTILWLVAISDDEVQSFENSAQGILDVAAGDPAGATVMMLPSTASPALLQALQKFCVLKALSSAEIIEFGGSVVQSVKAQVSKTIQEETKTLEITRKRTLIPKLLAAAFNAGPPMKDIEKIIKRVYEIAYHSAPPAFFEQYKQSGGTLRTAVKLVGRHLLDNTVHTVSRGANATADLLLEKFLVIGPPTSWGLLTLERRLQEPESLATRRAWDRLENAVPANGKENRIDKVVGELQRPPYGYDANTLSLLVCGWIGFHRHILRITVHGVVTAQAELTKKIEDSPAAFLTFLTGGGVSLQRQDRSKTSAEIRDIAERARRMGSHPYTRSEAVDAQAILNDFLDDEANEDPNERQRASEARDAISDALERAGKYDAEAIALRTSAANDTDITDLIRSLDAVKKLQSGGGVRPAEPPPDTIRTEIRSRLTKAVEKLCADNSALPDITHYEEQKRRLVAAKRGLTEHLDLVTLIDKAVETLAQAKDEHKGRQQDKETVAVLNTIETKGPLCQLRSRLECVSKAVCHSELAGDLRGRKQAAIESEVQKLEDFASSLDTRIDRIASGKDALALSYTIMEVRGLYDGATEADVVTAALTRCKGLAEIYELVERAQREISSVRNREQAKFIEETIVSALTEGDGILCPQQKASVKKHSDELAKKVCSLEESACEWLCARKKRAEQGMHLTALAQELFHPPSFLPADKVAELEELSSEVQRKLDLDCYGKVVHLFRQIADKQEQKKLLDELQAIVDAGQRVGN